MGGKHVGAGCAIVVEWAGASHAAHDRTVWNVRDITDGGIRMALVRQLYADIDVTRLATAFLLGAMRTIAYFAVGTMAMGIVVVCVALSIAANSPH